jgi:hypothetical protein
MCLPQRTGLDEMPTGRCRAPASGMRLSAAGQSHTPPIDKQRPKRPQKLPNRKKTRELRYPLSSICSAICYVNVLFETGESIKSLGEFIWTSSGRLTLKLTRRCGECHLAAALGDADTHGSHRLQAPRYRVMGDRVVWEGRHHGGLVVVLVDPHARLGGDLASARSRASHTACRPTAQRICWPPPSHQLTIGRRVNSSYCAGMSDGEVRTP